MGEEVQNLEDENGKNTSLEGSGPIRLSRMRRVFRCVGEIETQRAGQQSTGALDDGGQ